MNSDYDAIMRTLRSLAVSGNSVANLFLYQLYNCSPEERPQILRQITTFAASFAYEVGRVGPAEFKEEVTSWSIKI